MKNVLLIFATLLFIVGAALTKGYTYVNGEINPMITKWIWMSAVIGAILIILLDPVKKYAKKENLPPFEKMED